MCRVRGLFTQEEVSPGSLAACSSLSLTKSVYSEVKLGGASFKAGKHFYLFFNLAGSKPS